MCSSEQCVGICRLGPPEDSVLTLMRPVQRLTYHVLFSGITQARHLVQIKGQR